MLEHAKTTTKRNLVRVNSRSIPYKTRAIITSARFRPRTFVALKRYIVPPLPIIVDGPSDK
eukprot:scaffold32679_cov76-Amphora_coffeaeformis.AAC.1